MSLAEKLGGVPRNRGGQPHGLPGVLAKLDPADREALLKALANPDTNFGNLADVMRNEYGDTHSYGTWVRWGKDVRAGKFDG